MIDSLDCTLQQYDISHYGFLPTDEPLARLPHEYYSPWEDIISKLPVLIETESFYGSIATLPVLTTSRLLSMPEWRRAYVILTFFTHAHIWTGHVPNEVLPPTIVLPLLEVSKHLGLPPTATYPALNLWNCGLVSEGADITNPENVVMRHSFTGTPDESWFHAVSVSIEAKGVKVIQLMLKCTDAINDQADNEVVKCLEGFETVLTELGAILQRMHERCDPSVFYHRIRPFLAGGRGMEKAGLPRGIFYDEGNGQGSWRQYSGGSNAQSTLIQFFDIALGIKHNASGDKSGSNDAKGHIYLNEMRNYMPRSHRQFLDHFATISNLQQYLQSVSASPEVAKAFDRAVDALTAFRDIHMKIVARYIVAASRTSNGQRTYEHKNIASSSSGSSVLKGTGGTDLMAFLKQTRDETKAAKGPKAICA